MSARAGGVVDSHSSTASPDEEDKEDGCERIGNITSEGVTSGITTRSGLTVRPPVKSTKHAVSMPTDSLNNDTSLSCGVCGKGLATVPISIRCDSESCKQLFHPSCLENDAPFDNEKWLCQKCRPTDKSDVSIYIEDVKNHVQQQLPKTQETYQGQDEKKYSCPLCRKPVGENDSALGCDGCAAWFHTSCLFIDDTEYSEMAEDSGDWFCDVCRSVIANNIKWGSMMGEEQITAKVQAVYGEIVTWRKNMFLVPRGKSGMDFIKELTRLIHLFVDTTRWERLAFSLVHIFLPIMLQKPSRKSKARDHATYLSKRLVRWKNGELDDLMEECRSIQKALKQHQY